MIRNGLSDENPNRDFNSEGSNREDQIDDKQQNKISNNHLKKPKG